MNILEFHDISNQGADWTEAFRVAVGRLEAAGGGVLCVPAGVYPTGSIRLASHITLDVQAGATLLFHKRADSYPLIPLEFEGVAGLVHQPCVFAQGAECVKLTGDGVLDGQGDYWWDMVNARTLAHPRPYLVCFADCESATVENLNLRNSPVWTVHPLRCVNFVARGLRIKNPADSPNTDGINPDSCCDARIFDCTIDVGDDCIAIKSGTQHTLNPRACERVIISNCHFLHGHGGIVMGSEMSGGIRNVSVSDCVFFETDRGIRLKTRRGRGGVVEGIRLSNLQMERVMCPFVFNMYYFCGDDGKSRYVWDKAAYLVDKFTPALRDISITNVAARKCSACAGYFYGLKEMPIERVTLKDVLVEIDPDGCAGRPAMMEGCPDMRGAGFIMRNVRNIDISGASVIGARADVFDIDESVLFDNA